MLDIFGGLVSKKYTSFGCVVIGTRKPAKGLERGYRDPTPTLPLKGEGICSARVATPTPTLPLKGEGIRSARAAKGLRAREPRKVEFLGFGIRRS
jgi:hypothetical protein